MSEMKIEYELWCEMIANINTNAEDIMILEQYNATHNTMIK